MRVVLADFGTPDGDISDAIIRNGPISSPIGLSQYYIYVTQTVIGDVFMVSLNVYSNELC